MLDLDMHQNPFLRAIQQFHLDQFIHPLLAEGRVAHHFSQFFIKKFDLRVPINRWSHMRKTEFQRGAQIDFQNFLPRAVKLICGIAHRGNLPGPSALARLKMVTGSAGCRGVSGFLTLALELTALLRGSRERPLKTFQGWAFQTLRIRLSSLRIWSSLRRSVSRFSCKILATSGVGLICDSRSEEHTSELQSPYDLVCRLLLEKKKKKNITRLLSTPQNKF